MILALILAACDTAVDTGDSAEPEEIDYPDVAVCEPAVVAFDGPEEPHVNDTWTFWLTCDDVVQMGASRLSVDPATAGEIDDSGNVPVITWKQAGAATLKVQTGRFKGERAITILE
ncbi:MAG: hypothetical protein EXR71_16585 [Myxococcales bacterium]|nr:hypothetical protein [Myxococcales bacterium]